MKTKQLLKLSVFLFLLGFTQLTKAQCLVSFTATPGANGTVYFSGSASVTNSTTTYYWNYGNGSTYQSSSSSTSQITYTANGTYTVSLFVITVPSCSAQVTQTININNVCGLTANFSWSNSGSGLVNFFNQSVGSTTNTTYSWNFGDGGTSSLLSPSHTYTAVGNYVVSLTVSNSGTCNSTYTTNVAVCLNGFTITTGPNGQVFVTSTTPNTTSLTAYSWTITGNSYFQGSGAAGPTYTFSVPANGVYTVGMYVSSPCLGVVFNTVSVSNVTCNVNAAFNPVVGANGLVNFNNTSTGTVVTSSYLWNFGNGQIATTTNASQTYSANGTYTVKLLVNNGSNCLDSALAVITITNAGGNPCNLFANFSLTQQGNGAVSFNNTSTGTSAGVSYAWNFGDATNSTLVSPSHTYASSGTYTVTLSANNNYTYQCVSTKTAVVTVNVCNMTASFNYSIAPNGLVNFYNTSTGTSSVTTFYWSFGNGQTSTLTSPSITYTANGTYTVNLFLMSLPSCSLSAVPQVITITNAGGPCNLAASFAHTVGANGQVNFMSTSLGTNGSTTYFWNYGDGTSGTGATPSHVYSTSGTHVVVLTAMNGSTLCVNSATQSINITGIPCIANPNFTLNPTNVPQYWTATPAYPWNVVAASWSWGDGSSSNLLYTSHSYSAAGNYSICLSVTVSCGASSSACSTYSIYKMTSDMSIVNINVVEPPLIEVGIKNESQEPLAYSLYPNPNNGAFILQFSNPNFDKLNISISNIMGQEVFKTETEKFQGLVSKEIQLNELPNGVYFIQLSNTSQSITAKVVIDK